MFVKFKQRSTKSDVARNSIDIKRCTRYTSVALPTWGGCKSFNSITTITLFRIQTVHLDVIKVFYSPTYAKVNCPKNNFKIYIKINIKTAPTCFGAVTASSGSALLLLGKVTVVKISN